MITCNWAKFASLGPSPPTPFRSRQPSRCLRADRWGQGVSLPICAGAWLTLTDLWAGIVSHPHLLLPPGFGAQQKSRRVVTGRACAADHGMNLGRRNLHDPSPLPVVIRSDWWGTGACSPGWSSPPRGRRASTEATEISGIGLGAKITSRTPINSHALASEYPKHIDSFVVPSERGNSSPEVTKRCRSARHHRLAICCVAGTLNVGLGFYLDPGRLSVDQQGQRNKEGSSNCSATFAPSWHPPHRVDGPFVPLIQGMNATVDLVVFESSCCACWGAHLSTRAPGAFSPVNPPLWVRGSAAVAVRKIEDSFCAVGS